MLTDDTTCASPRVVLGGERFAAGSTISVTVSCSPSNAGLELVPVGAGDPQTYTAFAIVDPFRGVDE
jgi:hypothetical protein